MELQCYSEDNCDLQRMASQSDGSHRCSSCQFTVLLRASTPSAEWYEYPGEHRRTIKESSKLPFCKTCDNTMTSVASVNSLKGTRSIVFFCQTTEKEEPIHRLETYFRPLSEQEFTSIKKELKETYSLLMIWEILGKDFPIEIILDGPDVLERTLHDLTPSEQKEKIQCFKAMHAIGLLKFLDIDNKRIRFGLDKELLATKWEATVQKQAAGLTVN